MNRLILMTAVFLGIIGIILGAFAAHGLKQLIPIESVQTFETGVRYQMYHAFFLLIIGNLNFLQEKKKQIIFYLTCVGVLFFSGSIYGLATNSLTSFDFGIVGILTPIGGLLLISAWTVLLFSFLKMDRDKL